jgi:ferric-dicitrate binding protein FerR (iron transport regulator)
MTEWPQSDERASDPAADSDRIEQLLRLAGPREAVPPERLRRLRAAAHADWREQTGLRMRRRAIVATLGAVGIAAAVLLAVRVLSPDAVPPPRAARAVATTETVHGAVRVIDAAARRTETTLLQVGDRVAAGQGVDTMSGGQIALRLVDGTSVRVNGGTRLRLLEGTVLALDEGTIYIDSGGATGAPALEVRTPIGVARDIGTRFEVRLLDEELRVRVRDGRVQLMQSREPHEAAPGEELTLDGSGTVVRRAVPVFGAEWAWVLAVGRPFDLEGRTLLAFLTWIADENGWQLRFEDAAVERKAGATVLHGSIEGLTPEEALAAVLPSTGMEHVLEAGMLVVRVSARRTTN